LFLCCVTCTPLDLRKVGASKVAAIERGFKPHSKAVCQTVEVDQRIGQVVGVELRRCPGGRAYVLSCKMNPNYLLKEELRYELLVQGINSDSDVHTLRKLFRAVVADKVPCDLCNLSTQSVKELYELVVNKTLELQALIKQQEAELTLLAPRFRMRLSHLRGRLLHLTELDPSASGITSSRYQQVCDRLDNIETNLPKMDVADRMRLENEEEDMSAQDNPSSDERQDTGRVSTVMGTLDREVGTLADQIAPGNAGMVAAQVMPSGHGIKQEFTPHFYQRLPHPLSNLIKELPVVDGTEVNRLYEFLLRVLKVRQVGQMSDSAIYELMYPYCRDELLFLETQAINTKKNFENFYDRLLRHFIPAREMSYLRMARYKRVQAEGEHFFSYVQAIRDAALVLRINENEAQAVQRIIEGLTSTQRARFVFQLPPSSFRHLEQLATVDRSIAYADRSRAEPASEVQIATIESLSEPCEPVGSGKRSQDPRPRKVVVCFYCRKPGHTQSRCFLRSARKSKVAQTVKSSQSGLSPRARGIKGVVPASAPKVEAQIGNLRLNVLLDSGSMRSLISMEHFQNMRRGDPKLQLLKTKLTCVTASGQSLEIVGEVKVPLKIHGFSWNWKFLVSRRLQSQPILGVDFISKTKMILELGSQKCYFAFAPSVTIKFCQNNNYMLCSLTRPLSTRFPQVQTGKLSAGQKARLEGLIRQYPDVLSDKLGLTHLMEYEIQLTDNKPVRLPPYRLSPPKMQYLREHIKTLLSDGVIEPSVSNYSSPMFLVPKPGGACRAVVDFRMLNKCISIESVPLPDIHSAFHWFEKAKYFTTLDLNQAYHQIPLAKASNPLTAFCTDWNLYQYTRVPFGLATGAQVLSRLLDRVFQDIKFEFVYHYLDDVVIYSKSFKEHLKHIRLVLDRLRQAGLTVKPQKVVFATQEISFLGHLVSPGCIRIDPECTKPIR